MDQDFPNGARVPSTGLALHEGSWWVSTPSAAYVGYGQVALVWRPYPAVVVNFDCHHRKTESPSPLDLLGVSARAVDLKQTFPIVGIRTDYSNARLAAHRYVLELGRGDATAQGLSIIRFVLTNYHMSMGSWLPDAEVRLPMRFGGWVVTLDSLSDAWNPLVAFEREGGGYCPNHVGTLSREDGSCFSSANAQQALDVLRAYLSFSRGMRCGPFVTVGLDEGMNLRWLEGNVGTLDQWRRTDSWFDPHYAHDHVRVIEGLWTLWSRPEAADAVSNAIHWYTVANCRAGGVNNAIIAGQVALEIIVSSGLWAANQDQLKKGTAPSMATRLRTLLTSIGAPLEIPSRLERLQSLAAQCKWIDGPSAIVGLRNTIVHGAQSKLLQVGGDYETGVEEALTLQLHYIEFAVLAIVRYRGAYRNRTIPADVYWNPPMLPVLQEM